MCLALFKALFSGGGQAFNRMAKSFKEILDCMSTYSVGNNNDGLYRAAWLVKFGVYNSVEKWHWSPTAKLFIPDHMELGRVTLHEAMAIVMSQLMSQMAKLDDTQRSYVEDIMNGGQAYGEVDALVCDELKDRLRP